MSNGMELHEHLNQNIFSDDVERVANRVGYGEGLKQAGEENNKVVALSADLTGSTKTSLFAEAFPERFVQCGVAEQNMASVASGMAAMGKIPFVASNAMFSPGRSWEQVRTTIAYNDANVKIIGAHAGVSVGPDGATHQAIEDIAIMRVMPNMVVIAPADVHEARKATLWAAEYAGPVYIRLAREASPVITTPDCPFTFGKAMTLAAKDFTRKQSVGIITTGILGQEALLAAKALEEEAGVGASVVHIGTVKPLDEAAVLECAKNHDVIVTLEEHQRAGGLGGAVSEYLSGTHPTQVIRLGIDDQFGQSGTPTELWNHYGITADAVVEAVAEVLA